MVRKLKQRHLHERRHQNKAEEDFKKEVADQVHWHLRIPEEANDSDPGQMDHLLRSRGPDSRAGSLRSNRGTLHAQDIIIIKSRRENVKTVKKEKSENLTMVNQGPTTEDVRREGGCSLHFLREEGGLLGAGITGLVGKQQILGKIGGEIRGKICGRTWRKTRGKIWGKIGSVTIVITR